MDPEHHVPLSLRMQDHRIHELIAAALWEADSDASAVDDLTKLSMSSRVEEIFTSGAGAAQELTGDVEEEGNVPKEVRERPKGRRRSVRPARTEAEIAQIRAERAAKRELTGASPHQDGRG